MRAIFIQPRDAELFFSHTNIARVKAAGALGSRALNNPISQTAIFFVAPLRVPILTVA